MLKQIKQIQYFDFLPGDVCTLTQKLLAEPFTKQNWPSVT